MIIDLFKAFFSLIKLNLVILLSKIFFPKKIIIFFYWPKKHMIQNENYIEDLFDNLGKNFLVIFGFNSSNVAQHKHQYYIKYGSLKYIYNVDIFYDNVCVDLFTNKSIRIFMHHDIYDSPIIEKKKESNLFKRLIKYDFIFLSNNKNMLMFKNIFKKHNSDLNNKIPNLMEAGYPKLDYLKKKIKQNELIKNDIIVAPTLYNHVEKYSMFDDLKKIIEILLINTTSKVIFRPHPTNKKTPIVLKIEKNFKNEKNFRFDTNNDYFDTYTKSMCLITDISGTAYTYAFLTKKPVIFFSKFNTSIIDNPFVLKLLKKIKLKKIIYSGYPSYVIKNKNLLKQKILIHTHSGKLPEFRGSTTIFYSILLKKKIFALHFE